MDAHHHLWDLAVRDQGWLAEPGLEVLRRSFSTADLRVDAAGGVLGRPVGGTVVVQCLPSTGETEELLATAAGDDLVLGVVGWADLTAPGVGDELDRLAALPGGDLLVGVRHLVQGEADPRWLLRDDVRRGLDEVAARGLRYDVLVRPHQLAAAAELARLAPHVPLVLDHAGKPALRETSLGGWERDLRALAASEQVHCKLSGLVSEADPQHWDDEVLRPAAEVVLDAFGPARVAFGSDWPVCVAAGGWARWAAAAGRLLAGLSPGELDDVLRATAVRTYGLRARTPTTPTTAEVPCS
ncbi:amidohydrolase family protein [Kineosporiaceae bacterium B12]|nr:amidohydrolase family protein [Kineococcus rubinsiae]